MPALSTIRVLISFTDTPARLLGGKSIESKSPLLRLGRKYRQAERF
jgi:hypothetical protein